jgi:hypothetical protein
MRGSVSALEASSSGNMESNTERLLGKKKGTKPKKKGGTTKKKKKTTLGKRVLEELSNSESS